MKSLNDILRIAKYECRSMLRSLPVLLVLGGGIFFYGLLYNYMYSPNVLREVPVAIVDESRTPLSRHYIRLLDATPQVRVQGVLTDIYQARERMKQGEVVGMVFLPQDFEAKVGRGEEAVFTGTLTIDTNATGLVIDGLAFTGNAKITATTISNFAFRNNYIFETSNTGKSWDDTSNYDSGFMTILLPSGSTEDEILSTKLSTNLDISNNRFDTVDDVNIYIANSKDVSIVGNVFKNFEYDAIRFGDAFTDGNVNILNNELTFNGMSFEYREEFDFIKHHIDEFLEKYKNTEEELFIIGGKSIYEMLVNRVDYVYLTRINREHTGDVYLNCIDFSLFDLISSESVGELSFEIYKRKRRIFRRRGRRCLQRRARGC